MSPKEVDLDSYARGNSKYGNYQPLKTGRPLTSSTNSSTASSTAGSGSSSATQTRYKNYLQSGRLGGRNEPSAAPPPAAQAEPKVASLKPNFSEPSSFSTLNDSNLKSKLESLYSDLLKDDEILESDFNSSFSRDSISTNHSSIHSSPRISQAFDQMMVRKEDLPPMQSSSLSATKPWIKQEDLLSDDSSDDNSLDFEHESEDFENYSQILPTREVPNASSPPLPPAPEPFVYLSSTPRPKPRILDLSEEDP